MEDILKKAFEEASKLDPNEQKSFAAFIIEELKTEKKWHQAFQKSEKELRTLAEEAISDYRSGNTDALDPEKL